MLTKIPLKTFFSMVKYDRFAVNKEPARDYLFRTYAKFSKKYVRVRVRG